MTYLRRTNRVSKQSKLKAALVVFVLLVLFVLNLLFPRLYPSVFLPLTSLFWRAESSTVGFFVYMGKIVQSKYGLEVENRKLRDEIAARDASMLALDDVKSENESLKNAMGRIGKASVVLGVILSRPPASPYDTLVLDIGTNDGVRVGDKVYAEGDALIGDISEVYANQSKATLYSTSGRETPVLVGTTTIAAEATGKGGGNFVIKLPASAKVVKGAVISMPHIRTHVFGVVDTIMVDSSDSLQTILFRSPVNVYQLKFVEVEKK